MQPVQSLAACLRFGKAHFVPLARCIILSKRAFRNLLFFLKKKHERHQKVQIEGVLSIHENFAGLKTTIQCLYGSYLCAILPFGECSTVN